MCRIDHVDISDWFILSLPLTMKNKERWTRSERPKLSFNFSYRRLNWTGKRTLKSAWSLEKVKKLAASPSPLLHLHACFGSVDYRSRVAPIQLPKNRVACCLMLEIQHPVLNAGRLLCLCFAVWRTTPSCLGEKRLSHKKGWVCGLSNNNIWFRLPKIVDHFLA